MSSTNYDVFLSHNSADKPAVEELARRLVEEKIKPWLDKWNLIPGDPWQEDLESALDCCATCAVFIGPSGISPWQKEEMRAAIDRRVRERRFRVIPVLLPGAQREERSRLPAFMVATTWVEFRKSLDDEEVFHRLVCGIRGMTPSPGLGKPLIEGMCPYRGLKPFQPEHAPLFFGREALTEWLINELQPSSDRKEANRFLAIIGASGSGKSSLARAGLIPALQKGKMEGSQEWPIVILRPGQDPLESLAVALSADSHVGNFIPSVKDLISEFSDDPRTLHWTISKALHGSAETCRTFVLIDQFEEIFTHCQEDGPGNALIENTLYAANIDRGKTVAVLTMRADFYSKCDRYGALTAALSDHQVLVGPMTEEELRQAIQRPAQSVGCELEDGLVEALINDFNKQPGALPLLQHALSELWEGRKDRRLTRDAYQAMGKLEGALENYANSVFEKFDENEQKICQRIFLQLTQPGEGTEDTKRRASVHDLIPADAEDESTFRVIQHLAKTRLITTEGEKDRPADSFVEVAHEALIRGWSKLRKWIDSDREALLIHRRLSDTASEWAKAGHDESYLYRGSRLAKAEKLMRSNAQLMNPVDQEFMQKSKARRKKNRILAFMAAVAAGAIILPSVLIGRGISSIRLMPDLMPWHNIPQLEDNLTQASYTEFSEYLAAENQFLATIQNGVTIEETASFNRYARNNKSSPYVYGDNLNASFEFLPDEEEIKGGVLLVHGLTDSPYHLREIGRVFSDNGFYVIGLRLPGHGTVPGGLLNVTWEEWYSAVKFGARMVLEKIENRRDSKFYVGGFSTGGALTLRYFLETSSEKPSVSTVEKHRVPDKLLLLSPAIGVNPFAEILDWHQIISWMPWFKKFKWLEIGPEYDPFKYTSFSKNAGDQIYDLTKANQKLIEKIARNESIKEKLSPIYAFQSSVDATVKTDKLVDMYEKIASKESELFLFDINRLFETFINDDVLKDNLLHSEKIKNMVAKVWLISNKPTAEGDGYETSVAIKLVSKLTESDSPAEKEFGRLDELEWPRNVFALSHVCIPISPDDLYYGRYSILGGINAKGERDVLAIADYFVRVRYNPFFQLIKEQLEVSFMRSNE